MLVPDNENSLIDLFFNQLDGEYDRFASFFIPLRAFHYALKNILFTITQWLSAIFGGRNSGSLLYSIEIKRAICHQTGNIASSGFINSQILTLGLFRAIHYIGIKNPLFNLACYLSSIVHL